MRLSIAAHRFTRALPLFAAALAGGLLPAPGAWLSAPALAQPEQDAEPTLKLGDPAPKLALGGWIQGEPITAFQPGTVYVVEFWATWCGPCKATIPHLNQLAKKHQAEGLKMIGVSIWEEDPDAIAPFVKSMGDKMQYPVAFDRVPAGGEPTDGAMSTAWMQASGQRGIPTAFVVDREGRIAFIGHPLQLDAVLPKVLAGNYDAKAEQTRRTTSERLQQQAQRALAARDWDTALARLEELAKADPSFAGRTGSIRFDILLQGKKDLDAAYALADRLAASDLKDDAEALNSIAWTIVDRPGLARRDLDLAMKLATRAVELTKAENAAILDTLARVHFEKGDKPQAIEWQQKAVDKARDPGEKAELSATLKKYQTP
jgi:thiol-disulfide isomerase/thioredoxin